LTPRNFKELRADLDKRLDEHPDGEEIRTRVRADLEAELAAHEHTLGDLRKARRLTQDQLARALGVSQAQVSRIESQTDLYLSTLQSYLEAMGGRLEIFGVFGDRAHTCVPLSVGELGGWEPPGQPDLMAALEASIKGAKRQGGTAAGKPRKKAASSNGAKSAKSRSGSTKKKTAKK
jgi:transcriptional regulator with XRE-family HTH domain